MINNQSAAPLSRWSISEILVFAAIIIFGAAIRMIFFAGFQGSDEVTYLGSALGVFDGSWPAETYIGALRYGINIPMAAGLGIFGLSELGASAWGFICSLGEIVIVYLAAKQIAGQRAALFSALLLATLPLHVHEATRMIADPPHSFFMTLGFFLLWLGERDSARRWYFLAGLSFGATYWIKDAVFFIALFSVAVYALMFRRFHWRWLHFAAGAITIVALNLALMQWVQGNWLHLFASGKNSLGRIESSTTPFFYAKYLLIDLRHFWLVPILAIGGGWLAFSKGGPENRSLRLYGTWLVVFLIVLSLLPLRQSNYLLLVAAPLALLAGVFLASLKRHYLLSLMPLVLVGSVLLSALQQQSLHVFTANSRASVAFAETHPDAVVFAGTGAYRADTYTQYLRGESSPLNREAIKSLAEFDRLSTAKSLGFGKPIFIIEDPVTAWWGDKVDREWSQRRAKNCLAQVAELVPAPLGLGKHVSNLAINLASSLPGHIQEKLISTLRPARATVYRVNECNQAKA